MMPTSLRKACPDHLEYFESDFRMFETERSKVRPRNKQ